MASDRRIEVRPNNPASFAIVDCNNFYASCERLFKPGLNGKPVVVLSNNDGCIIARSNEAKALGLKMGEPYFKVEQFCKDNGVSVFSSNYTLYGDLSRRVMSVLSDSWPDIEIYSIDEAFLELTMLPQEKRLGFCMILSEKIRKYTGIPVSIGIGPTKTLAKAANFVSKKKLKVPAFDITSAMHWLQEIPVGEIWGIGRQYTKKLNQMGVMTAGELSQRDSREMKSKFNVMVERTVLELQSISCLGLEDISPRKSIVSSRSFSSSQKDLAPIAEALSSYCATAARKLREQDTVAYRIAVMIFTNAFKTNTKQYNNSKTVRLITPTSDTTKIIHCAKKALRQIYRKGYEYKKVGVSLEEIVATGSVQADLFQEVETDDDERANNLMDVLDGLNKKFGPGTLKIASEGLDQKWAMKRNMMSQSYTTSWKDLPIVKIDGSKETNSATKKTDKNLQENGQEKPP